VLGYVLKRLGLALVTLFLLTIVVFAGGQVLPGDPGRAILGPLASRSSVATLDRQLGANRPILAQYWTWFSHLFVGNLGTSYAYRSPVAPLVWSALGNSLKLAGLALVMLVPLSIVGGVVAALRRGRATDTLVSTVGLSLATVPEFVTGTVLIIVFGTWLKVLPVSASAGAGASIAMQLRALVLPALALVTVLFGYVARIARAGTIEALSSDYVRTATLKGLPAFTVLRRHVLRNALLPTITVLATQCGYLIGGLFVIETLFNYQGIGSLVVTAARQKDFPLLEGGILVVGVVYVVVMLLADLAYTWLSPRLREAVIT
jgi:peptide/nickel transport system permease protein